MKYWSNCQVYRVLAISVGAVVHNDQELFRAPTESHESCRSSREAMEEIGLYRNVKLGGIEA